MSGRLRLGMVGGGRGAFIGAVHRIAARLDGEFELVAGALSSAPERARESGRELGLADDRSYSDWREMAERESSRPDSERPDAVAIVTPNHLHYPVARTFLEHGFNIICDKPLAVSLREALELERLVAETGALFAVTYNYTGYPLVREARELVRSGRLGTIRKVLLEYTQGWLAGPVETEGNKQAAWRTDPARSGPAGALGDIGTHAENLITTVTGLDISHLSADLTSFVPGRELDDDVSVLLRFHGGARGVLTASQVCFGEENSLTLRVYGDRGGLRWEQERPEELVLFEGEGARRILKRGNAYLSEAARMADRVPPGHPEGFLEGFANIYLAVAEALRARRDGNAPAGAAAEFPDVSAGVRGVRFVEKVLENARSTERWTAF
ncbi:MAG TPA: Gfo/Idh/MocA family oxidoreductase [Deinococcales bacterium]|nr:Gfo/Idh/MocA family oxidoreductase [Deinococcales bacterium]